MSLKCKIGAHHWDGCQCLECGAVRNDHHDLKHDCEKCAKCGQTVENNHDWSKDCERCHRCGKTREHQHSWAHDCEKCSKCGKTRHGHHHMVHGMCSVCGHGVFTDSDGKHYKVVKIGTQIVMAENFAHKPQEGNFFAYDNNDEHIAKFGYLYDLETAKSIAPKGWHLPTKAEWEKLFHSIGGHAPEVFAAMKMNGASGFDAVFGGWRYVRGTFSGLNGSAHFWSSTAEDDKHAWHFKLMSSGHHAELEKAEIHQALSVRYFKDE